jgi:uncharacterized protein YdcH (DUF465 family)
MTSQAQVIGKPPMKTWDDYEQGCLDTYGGGHRFDGQLEAFRHGMQTVFNLLRREFPPAEEIRRLQQQADEVDRLTDRVEELTGEIEHLRERLAVKCQQPEAATCAKLWEVDHARRQLEAVDPALADEFPWGCDTVEHLATALLAAREGVTE